MNVDDVLRNVKARQVAAAGTSEGAKKAAMTRFFKKGHQESYDFHKPKADYYAQVGDEESKGLHDFHAKRAKFHKEELEKLNSK